MHTDPARRTGAATAPAAATDLGLTACGSPPGDRPAAVAAAPSTSSPSAPGTIALDPPDAKPAVNLTDQDGHPYDLAWRTAGHPTPPYFGRTHCPDVCPTTRYDIAVAARSLPSAGGRSLRVVFVNTDPARDTSRPLRSRLGAIDPDFIGLTGDFTDVRKAARSLGVGISRPVKHEDGSETVRHGAEAEVFVFSPKGDKAHLSCTAGTSEQRYAADLPGIFEGERA